jgi:hypothetical protein
MDATGKELAQTSTSGATPSQVALDHRQVKIPRRGFSRSLRKT